MLKFSKPAIYIILTSLVFTISCTTIENPPDKGVTINIYETPINFSDTGFLTYLQTKPLDGSPVFFASAKRMNNREDEKTAALLKASEQASKYIAIQAVSKFYSEKANSSTTYISDLDIQWDRNLAIEMIEKLEILNISEDTYGSYILARLPEKKLSPIPVNLELEEGVPEWINRTPKIPGYIASVGIALQKGYVSDSFTAADNQALEDLSRQISVKLISGEKKIENSLGTAIVQTNYESSEVVIPGFYILERWRTPDARYYYSLAIAPESILENYRYD